MLHHITCTVSCGLNNLLSACNVPLCRQQRKDAVSEEWKQAIQQWWEDNTRPYNNHTKTVGKRLRGAEPHAIHHKEETNTEMFKRFCADHPDITVGQRTFETLMPHYVRPMRERLRLTCSCKEHSDMHARYKSIRAYRDDLVSRYMQCCWQVAVELCTADGPWLQL